MKLAINRKSALKPALAVAFALLQAGFATPSLATTTHVRHHHHRAADPAPGYATTPGTIVIPGSYHNPLWPECTEDEGNGRVTPCDGAG